ncbi:LysR substrate-binding domain-containing protein [Rhodospirillum centenum]|uniref:Hydrogen peroxide-inducible genes activator protein n=1 Tax=Rhodospirillum centenum (strain ATCC 51521 / SW) TaxID=414684 RepID=B6IQZ1_RHOCS|nr:LysR substrate-binding domain-containing protein [Rhodospirillum centenum]ACI97877.1 hydrogen peroxide-inducible genes activator protein [Rhodospirillum centenum SW]
MTAITLRQLRYLVALADTLHFGRAAAACHVSQPSLSAQIQQLESLLGTALVERTKHRVLLTPAGKDTVRRARDVLAAVDDMSQMARAAGRPLCGALRLGVIPTIGPYLLPGVLPGLRRDYPDLRLYLREDLTERLLDRLRAGDLDAAVLALPVAEPGLETVDLFEEPFLVALPQNHPLSERTAVRQSDLSGEVLLLLEDGHCFRDQALDVCRLSGAREDPGFAATSLPTLVEMVAGGLGLTLLPARAAPLLTAAGQVVLRPFVAPVPVRRVGLVWRRGSVREADLQRLAGHLAEGTRSCRC